MFGGKKLFKDNNRIEAYGSIDEFNAQVGVVISLMNNEKYKLALLDIQKNLFTIGAILATDPLKLHLVKPFKIDSIADVEKWIDEMEETLPPLKSFILPSGSILVAQCHVARTICRRAERRIVSLYKETDEPLDFIIYVNRLSDFFFVLARKMCLEDNCVENLWLGD